SLLYRCIYFFFQAEDGIRDATVTGVQTCALPIYPSFQILALDANTGATKWQIVVPNSFEDLDPGSAMVVANGFVYFSDKNGSVYALHESNGAVAWSTQIAKLSADDVSTPAIGANGVLYV